MTVSFFRNFTGSDHLPSNRFLHVIPIPLPSKPTWFLTRLLLLMVVPSSELLKLKMLVAFDSHIISNLYSPLVH